MLTSFERLNKQIIEKNSHIILGLDPTDDMKETIELHGGLEDYLKWLIDETHQYIVGVKPNLAFFEKSNEQREIMKNVLKYASENYGLIKILDVKRGDIMDTQKEWAKADIGNFNPDIVTLNPYMGGVDVVKPYLDLDENICAYVLTATSNPGAREFQDEISGGVYNYQKMAILARKWDEKRVGFVVGSTKPDAIKNIRAIEIEHGYRDNLAPILAPGFGKQGGNLDFVELAGPNAVYPISSALTNAKYLGKNTPKEAAKLWRDQINSRISEKPLQSITEIVIDNMVKEDLIWVPKKPEVYTWQLLKKGKKKLNEKGISIKDLIKDDREKLFSNLLTKGILNESDFGLIFLQIRDIIGTTETRRLFAYLYAKLILDTKVEYDRIGSIAYGAINTGDLVSLFLNKPAFLLRKERGQETTHDDILGYLNEGDKAIMIEDVTTSADSLVSDIILLRETLGAKIEDAFVFCKRTSEGEENCLKNGINLHYIMDMDQLKQYIGTSKSINEDVKKLILRQR